MRLLTNTETDNPTLRLCGTYRAHDESPPLASALSGCWLEGNTFGSIDARTMTRKARAHPGCIDPDARVSLRPALVSMRSGAFLSNEEAVYRAQRYAAEPQTQRLAHDLLDMTKLLDHWHARMPLLRQLFGADAAVLQIEEDELIRMAIDGHMCREGGRLLGSARGRMLREGHVKHLGNGRCSLAHLEEFRAIVNAWDLALSQFDEACAEAVVRYLLLQQLGRACAYLQQGVPGAGYVPYLVFRISWHAGLLHRAGSAPQARLQYSPPNQCGLRDAVRALVQEITLHEAESRERLCDVGTRGMLHLRTSLADGEAVAAFRECIVVLQCTQASTEVEGNAAT